MQPYFIIEKFVNILLLEINCHIDLFQLKIFTKIRTTLADFYYLLPANILCNHACLIKWKNDAIAECKICNALETCRPVIYECCNVQQIENY